MLRSAIKASSQSRTPSHHGPMPNADSWSAPSDWDQAPFHLSAPSSTSLLSSVDTVTTGSSKTVGFAASSNVSFDTASSGTRDPSAPFGGQAEGKIVLRVYRFHSKMKTAYSLLVDERTEDPVFYSECLMTFSFRWPTPLTCAFYCFHQSTTPNGRPARGLAGYFEDKTRVGYGLPVIPSGLDFMPDGNFALLFSQDLLFSVRRTGLSSKFEIVRHHNGETLTTTLSGSGMIKKKWSFKGYDGNRFVLATFVLNLSRHSKHSQKD